MNLIWSSSLWNVIQIRKDKKPEKYGYTDFNMETAVTQGKMPTGLIFEEHRY